MKVIVIGIDLNPPLVEGIRNTVYEIYRRLIGYLDVCFITKGYRGMSALAYVHGIKIYRVLTNARYGHIAGIEEFNLKAPYYLSNIIKRESPDIIHVHSSFPLFNAYICFIAKCKNPNLLSVNTMYSSVFNVDPYEERNTLKHVANLVAKRPILSRRPFGDVTIVISKRAYDIMRRHDMENIVYFPHIAIDVEKFYPNLKCGAKVRDELGINYNDIVILFGGDLSPVKGVEILLYALRTLIKKYIYGHRLKVIILNKGVYERNSIRVGHVVNIIQKLNLAKFVKFIGVRNDIECVMNAADIIVFPYTKNYGFMDIPRTILEAMSCGKPVVASSVGAIGEYVINGITGFVFPPNDVRSLVQILLGLVDDERTRYKIGLRARTLIKNLFNADKVSRRMLQFYHDLLNSM